jgi:hypothetical protein
VSTLHITNGDSVADKLRSVFDGPVSITADILHEGPALEIDGPPWYEQRARFLASNGPATVDEVRSTLEAWDDQIASAAEHDETVLWFEHDLFDQLLLVRTLDRLGGLRGVTRPPRVSLICINAFLGHLTATELRGLWPTRAPVTCVQYAISRQVWHSYRQPDPSGLVQARHRLKTDRESWAPLPFLGDALERFFEEFPATTNGLSRTANAALQVLDGAGPLSGGNLFRRNQDLESRMFLGDTTFFHILGGLARARVPLVGMSGGEDPAAQQISITAAGRAVSRGELDAVRLNGVDTWRGGVHLSGPEAAWRWDPARKTLISWT